MRIFALELDNDIKGIDERKKYIEGLISALPSPDLVVLPELALCSYMACDKIWKYADNKGKDTAEWAICMARKYHTYIGLGYLDKDEGDFYNRYMIAGEGGVLGTVTKSEGESAVFKRGWFDNVISTPFGRVGVAICYDSRRKHFYDNVKNEELSLILFPHGAPADPKKAEDEIKTNDYLCGTYMDAFGVPVVYVNSYGKLEYMPGMMGKMMADHGFLMNGRSKIYFSEGKGIDGFIAADVPMEEKRLKQEIRFYGKDLIRGNLIFRYLILNPDTKAGIKAYDQKKGDFI